MFIWQLEFIVRFELGPADGYDQEQGEAERDEIGIDSLCFLTFREYAFETLDLTNQLFDTGAQFVEPLGKEFPSALDRASMRSDRDEPSAWGSPRLDLASYPWSVMAALGVRSGPMSRSVSNWRLSLVS
jgi:hypothetical protein